MPVLRSLLAQSKGLSKYTQAAHADRIGSLYAQGRISFKMPLGASGNPFWRL